MDPAALRRCQFFMFRLAMSSSTSALNISLFYLASVVAACLAAGSLPSYITSCSRNDPKLNECVVKAGQKAIPKFINGDPAYRVPNLNPLSITRMNIAQGTQQVGLNISMRDVNLYGLPDTVFTKARVDLKKQYAEWDFTVPKVELIGNYTVTGRVLLLPISGDGKANITLTGVTMTYKHGWDLVKKKSTGKEHAKISLSELVFDTEQAHFHLENLFNGDRLLGDNMNRFLNENSKDVVKEIGPAMSKTFANLYKDILTTISELVPFDIVYKV